MRFENGLIAATTLFASASAFLVTPEMAKAASEAQDGVNTLIFGAPQTIVDVKCYDCPFVVGEKTTPDGLKATAALVDVENVIRLEFTDNNGQLQVNNATIYPFEAINSEAPPSIIVHQIRTDTGENGPAQFTDFVIGVKEIITPPRFSRSRFGRAKPEEIQVVPIEFTIFALGSTPVKAESTLIDLIHEDGKYSIARTQIVDFEPPTIPDFCGADVNPTLCRMRAMFVDRFRSMFDDAQDRVSKFRDWMKTHPSVHPSEVGNKAGKKPCGGRPGGKGRHGMVKDHPFDFAGNHKGPHAHHRHHRGHKIAHVIHLVIHTFLIPAILGVAGGLAASAIGMAVGQAIASLWFRYGRGGQRGSVENARSHEDCVVQDEKDGMMDGEDLPRYEDNQVPEYEDAPRYEDEGRQV